MRVLSMSRKLLYLKQHDKMVELQTTGHSVCASYCILGALFLWILGTCLNNIYLLPETFLLSISPPKKGSVWKEMGRKYSFLTSTWLSCLHCLVCQIKSLLGYTGMRVSFEKSEWPWYLISCCTAGRDTDQNFMKGYFVLNVSLSILVLYDCFTVAIEGALAPL